MGSRTRARPKKEHKKKINITVTPTFLKVIDKLKPDGQSRSQFLEYLGRLGLTIHAGICRVVRNGKKT